MTTQAPDKQETERRPPNDTDAEKALLGSILTDNRALDAAAAIVSPSDFYDWKHRTIFEVMIKMWEQNEPIDIVTLTNKLIVSEQLNNVGGRAYLVELQEDVYSAANADRYAQIIQEKSSLRQLIAAAMDINSRAMTEEDPKELIESADRAFFQIACRGKASDIRTQGEVARSFMSSIDETVEARLKPEIQKRWLRTGLVELDSKLFRLDSALMTIIAARPGDGKTVLSLQICDWLDRCGIPTAFESCEMPEEQMLLRLVTNKSEIPMWKIRTGDLTDGELARVYQEAARYGSGECKLHIDHIKGKKTPFEIRRRLRFFKREFDIKLAVIDYVQLLSAPGHRWGTRNEELTFISSFLMETASELGIHLINVSQMSRPDKGRPEREPQLEDLRDCGGLEQDANNVLFIYHPYRHSKDRIEFPENYAHLILRKQRQGPIGRVKVFWDAEHVRFNSMMEALPV